MSGEERQLFLGDSLGDLETQVTCHQLSDETLISGDWPALLAKVNPTIILAAWRTPPIPLSHIRNEKCALQYVAYAAGSIRHLVPREFLEKGGRVTNWGNIVAWSVAEHAVLLALAALRNLGQWKQAIFNSPSIPRPAFYLQTMVLRGKRVGIHGYGTIARCILDILRPFDVEVTAYSAGVPRALMCRDGVTPCQSLEELFRTSEVLFECEALRLDTEGSVTAEVLACLPDHAVFVNVGRGHVVEEEALVREAQSGRIRVALDVARQEPLHAGAPLMHVDHLIASPHIGGPAADQYRTCGNFVLENVRKYMDGVPLDGVVTLDIYDRAT